MVAGPHWLLDRMGIQGLSPQETLEAPHTLLHRLLQPRSLLLPCLVPLLLLLPLLLHRWDLAASS
jgi:hypothetical protein